MTKVNLNGRIMIGTHSGKFHSDEVLAIALLMIEKTYSMEDVYIARTRDVYWLARCDYVIDVGGEYNKETLFDHHQYTDEVKEYSSAGLVYKDLFTKKSDTLEILVKETDDHDNGIVFRTNTHFCGIISLYNGDVTNNVEQNELFKEAVQWTIRHVRNIMKREDTDDKTYELVSELNKNKLEYNGITYVSTQHIINSKMLDSDIMLVLLYNEQDDITKVRSLDTKILLIEPTYKDDELFIHKNGFIAKYKGKKTIESFNLKLINKG